MYNFYKNMNTFFFKISEPLVIIGILSLIIGFIYLLFFGSVPGYRILEFLYYNIFTIILGASIYIKASDVKSDKNSSI